MHDALHDRSLHLSAGPLLGLHLEEAMHERHCNWYLSAAEEHPRQAAERAMI